MDIPKIFKNNSRKYKLIKEYPNYVLYEETIFKYKECFNKQDLGLIEEKEKPYNTNPQKVKYL